MIEKIKSKGNSTFWCLVGIFLTGALPLFTNYCLNSAEVPYQLVRIENMKDYLSAGIFQMAMPVNWQYEHGTAGLDGNLFWLLPVLLRMTGAALESVYRMFLICIYAVTVCFSYKTLEEGFQNKKTAVIGTALYCWAPWYLDALYGRAAIGEALGYAFLPVLLLFLVRAVGRKKGKLPQWLLLAIAISLLLQSSFAVLEVGMLLLVFCCVYYRRQLLEKDGWLTLGKAAAATLLGNLWYLLPMLRYLVAYRDVARYVGSRPFQEKGAFLLHYLTFFFQGGATYDYKSKGFQGTAAIGVGPALTGLFFFLLWCGMLGILLSLGSFPWDLLRQNAVFQVLTFSMQSPTIFMIPAICGLTFIVCGLLNTYREEKSATEATILETAVLAVAFVSTQFLTNKLLLGRAPLWIRQKEDLPDVVLIEAPQFQMSAAAGAAQLVAVALSALGIVGIVIYCILTQKKNPDRKVQKEAA